MRIFKETNIKNPLYITRLANGVTLFVFDGYAEGSDGRVYHCVLDKGEDGQNVVIGWQCEEFN